MDPESSFCSKVTPKANCVSETPASKEGLKYNENLFQLRMISAEVES